MFPSPVQTRTELSAGDVASLFGHGNIAGQLRKYKAVSCWVMH